MKTPKILLVGGDFGENPRKSGVVEKIAATREINYFNGGTIEDLKKIDLKPYDVILWMPNISNDEEKYYPKKPLGSVLIVTKVLRDENSELEAISRIFRMSANAVITIDKKPKYFSFKAIDALGNCWGQSDNPKDVIQFCRWIWACYGSVERIGSEEIQNEEEGGEYMRDSENLNIFMAINHRIADKAQSMGGRYFGNCSTRCDKLFPSARVGNNLILVSPRNIDKGSIFAWDMVSVEMAFFKKVKYYGNKKPSVDTPVQLMIYQNAPRINYMIHGHYYIYGAPFTQSFYPCGDLREYKELAPIIASTYNKYTMGAINLNNHGFLLYSSNLEEMKELAEKSIFIKRSIGDEPINLGSYWGFP